MTLRLEVTAISKPIIAISNPKISNVPGKWPRIGHANKAAIPGASAGNTAARAGPKIETIFA